MTLSPWAIWLIIAASLLIIELLSGTALALCLAAGCLAAAIAAIFTGSLVWQASIFVVASVISLIFLGPAVRKLYAKSKGKVDASTNMDALIGRIGKVTHRVTNLADDKGRVQIDGDSWLAYTHSAAQPLERGTQVKVLAFDSNVIKVEPAQANE